jgi:hypothetical protein
MEAGFLRPVGGRVVGSRTFYLRIIFRDRSRSVFIV